MFGSVQETDRRILSDEMGVRRSIMVRKSGRKCFGIIGGLGAIAGADIFFKLVKSTPAYSQEAPRVSAHPPARFRKAITGGIMIPRVMMVQPSEITLYSVRSWQRR